MNDAEIVVDFLTEYDLGGFNHQPIEEQLEFARNLLARLGKAEMERMNK